MPAEVSSCEKARILATSHYSTERRGCQALGTHADMFTLWDAFYVLFSCLSQRGCLIFFCKETCFFQQGQGIGRQEPGSELPRLFPKQGVGLQLPPDTPLRIKVSSPRPHEEVKEGKLPGQLCTGEHLTP